VSILARRALLTHDLYHDEGGGGQRRREQQSSGAEDQAGRVDRHDRETRLAVPVISALPVRVRLYAERRAPATTRIVCP
jgi:hypothetical protein